MWVCPGVWYNLTSKLRAVEREKMLGRGKNGVLNLPGSESEAGQAATEYALLALWTVILVLGSIAAL